MAPSIVTAFPPPDERSLIAFYGQPGPSQLVMVALPYPMRLAWALDTVVSRQQCHRRVAASLTGVLEAIRDYYGSPEALAAARMDLLGGIYNLRRQRLGSSWSLHAWGAAIDLDPEANGLQTPWPGAATMPPAVVELFEAAGWTSGGRRWGRDAMHFQGTA